MDQPSLLHGPAAPPFCMDRPFSCFWRKHFYTPFALMVSSSQRKERFVLPSIGETAKKTLDFDFKCAIFLFQCTVLPVTWHLIAFPAVSACWSMLHFFILIGVLMGLELLQSTHRFHISVNTCVHIHCTFVQENGSVQFYNSDNGGFGVTITLNEQCDQSHPLCEHQWL